ncbi:metallophosphoesterase family protein [Sphingomonas sp. RHCKR7]|uniref:metallophosphoesterase family protein n=1 Tax=Sphingomonas folli TaxID=2862497 RepID=UPI001CA4EF65|nr:metallophosphoesterase family protein [Sphingomonas folli]MBW6526726.1 metallophosphoesterase family protein [Sphingomonas folli]
MTIWFTADTHLGDHRTINIWHRPFPDVSAMDAHLVERWNATVAPEDTVWHLGDVARRADAVAPLLACLNGTKHLLRGNNDPAATLAAPGWASVGDYAELELDGHRLVLGHYPFRSWNGQHRGAINLHGHSHGRLAPMKRQYDVGVDVHDFAPVTLAQLLAAPSRKPPTRTLSKPGTEVA